MLNIPWCVGMMIWYSVVMVGKWWCDHEHIISPWLPTPLALSILVHRFQLFCNILSNFFATLFPSIMQHYFKLFCKVISNYFATLFPLDYQHHLLFPFLCIVSNNFATLFPIIMQHIFQLICNIIFPWLPTPLAISIPEHRFQLFCNIAQCCCIVLNLFVTTLYVHPLVGSINEFNHTYKQVKL